MSSVILFALVALSIEWALAATADSARTRRRLETDVVTGIGNRVLLYRLVRRHARRRGWPVGVLFVDLNGFKAVNDTYGHIFGDRVLSAVPSVWPMPPRLARCSCAGAAMNSPYGSALCLPPPPQSRRSGAVARWPTRSVLRCGSTASRSL